MQATMQLLWFLLLSFITTVTPQSLNSSSSLVWGAFRPNLLKPRIPQFLMTGLVWFGTQDYQSFTKARHACDQGDGLDGYTWTQFDAREGGIQVLKDTKNNVKVTTELMMVDGGEHGGAGQRALRESLSMKRNPRVHHSSSKLV